ncbi:Geranylgeranyl diphosphate reductase, chloroplastic [Ananas comosus]|uniref:Geranylgeranyl diphosphate reductase, chloroplastic n=1 Tax=Ananas comosus TaxID=4615 RepID=A0A199UP87_ANACO|nr:Geranylgeranyl diphosphate reductase, chloroplastic [Ananas comosus]
MLRGGAGGGRGGDVPAGAEPRGAKPCGGAIPLPCSTSSPSRSLVDRRVTRMRLLSPSNLASDFSRHLRPAAHIAMLRARSSTPSSAPAPVQGAHLLPALLTSLSLPSSPLHPTSSTTSLRRGAGAGPATSTLAVDVVVGADGANSRVARCIGAGDYSTAIAFQERMYVGDDVSPDFYAWVFPKCDHVAVGTGTAAAKPAIRRLQAAARARAAPKLAGGVVVRVEAHPIPEHPRPRRVAGRAALVGDAAGYVARCSGEGIYFAAKSGRMCGDAIVRIWKEKGRVAEADLKREYLRRWDEEFAGTFRFLDALQRVFYGSNAAREALVELCSDEYVQRMTFDSYLHKKMAAGRPLDDLGLLWKSAGSLLRATILGREVERLRSTL